MAESRLPENLGETVPADATPGGLATPEFIASLLVDGDDDLAAWAIGQALEEHSRSSVFDDVVRRAMELVGTRWETGQWSISQEHLASVALAAALARLRPADADETRIGPVAVLAAPEGEHHVAGLICLAQILEEHGWRAENLGANVPADDLQRFVSGRTVDLVALSIGTRHPCPLCAGRSRRCAAVSRPTGRCRSLSAGTASPASPRRSPVSIASAPHSPTPKRSSPGWYCARMHRPRAEACIATAERTSPAQWAGLVRGRALPAGLSLLGQDHMVDHMDDAGDGPPPPPPPLLPPPLPPPHPPPPSPPLLLPLPPVR